MSFSHTNTCERCNSYVHKGDTHWQTVAVLIAETVLSTLRLLFRGFVGSKGSGEVFAQREDDGKGGYPFLHTSETTLTLLTAATWWALLITYSTLPHHTHMYGHHHITFS